MRSKIRFRYEVVIDDIEHVETFYAWNWDKAFYLIRKSYGNINGILEVIDNEKN